MRLPISITTVFGRSAAPSEESSECDFDLISKYFYKAPSGDALQTIDAETTVDLDLNAVFERIDRTSSKVGQQYLYARLRTLRGAEEVERFGLATARFEADAPLAERCACHLNRLTGEEAYGLCDLIFDTPSPVQFIKTAYLLTATAIAAIALSFFHPLFLLLFGVVLMGNLYIHYTNKLNISLYASAVKQLSKAQRTARGLCAEGIPGSEEALGYIRRTAEVERRSRIVGAQSDSANEIAALVWLLLELLKAAFNIEVILFHRFIGSITAQHEAIHGVFRFIGQTDAALSVMRLRQEAATCTPEFTDGKYLQIREATHPLIDACTANTLTLDGESLLLTGSNMSGKSTFIRTLTLNALLAQTLWVCFAEAYKAPYMLIFSSICISDDIQQGASYYLKEVQNIKKCLDASQRQRVCLFALDELFKGTNTTERIAAGKAVLAYLNQGPHIVLVSTHDTELTGLLRDERYALHHFREEILDGRLVFDYRLHAGQPTTRNAIRILELYDYPRQVIEEAYQTRDKLST